MPTRPKKPAVLRDSWRPIPRRRGIYRHLKRLFVTAMALALLACLTYLLLSPFWHPNLHVRLFTSGDYQIQGPPPIKQPAVQRASLSPLRAVLPAAANERTLEFRQIEGPTTFESLIDDLNQASMRSSDVIVLYLSAHGVAVNGRTFLLCNNYDPTVAEDGRYPTRQLLAQLEQLPAAVKLLILDAGYVDYAPEQGLIVNEFPSLLREEVANTSDEGLWVLVSHSEFETSRQSRSLGGSVFGYFVTDGLSGQADANHDLVISVQELYEFVSSNVLAWAESTGDGEIRQTPMLLRGASAEPFGDHTILLTIAPPPSQQTTVDGDEGSSTAGEESQGDAASKPDGMTPPAAAEVAATSPPSNPSAERGDKADQPDAESSGVEQESEAGDFGTSNAQSLLVEFDQLALPLDAGDLATESQPTLVDQAWQVVEGMTNRPRDLTNPIDVAPHLWRELLLIVQGYAERTEAMSTAETVDLSDKQRHLTRLVTGLREMEAGQSIPQPTPQRIVERLRDSRIQVEMNADRIRSLGLRQAVARYTGISLSQAEQDLVASLDRVRSGAGRAALDEWIAATDDRLLDRFIETRVAQQLAGQPQLSWPTVQRLLDTYRVGEQVAANLFTEVPWIRTRIETADRLRLSAARTLHDSVLPDPISSAEQMLADAMREYRQADDEIGVIQQTLRTRNELLIRTPEYVRLRHAAGPLSLYPRQQDLRQLLQILSDICDATDDLSQTSAEELRALAKRATSLSEQIEAELLRTAVESISRHPDDDSGLATVYLQSSIPTTEVRQRLLAVAQKAGHQFQLDAVVAPRIGVKGLNRPTPDWRIPLRQLELEMAVARLARLHPSDDAGAWDHLQSVYSRHTAAEANSSTLTSPEWNDYREIGQALREFYQGLPSRIEEVVRSTRDLSQTEDRNENLQRLTAMERSLYLVDPRYNEWLDVKPGLVARRHARLYDLLTWQADRFRQTQDDAPQDELAFARQAVAQYRLLANALPDQPRLPSDKPSMLQVNGANYESLVSTPEAKMEFTVEFRGQSETPAWIVVDYDPQLIEVISNPGTTIYVGDQLRTTLHERAAQAKLDLEILRAQSDVPDQKAVDRLLSVQRSEEYPLSPRDAELTPSLLLRPGDTRTLELTVRAKSKATSPTKLIVKAIQAGEYVRHEAAIRLPGSGRFQLTPVASGERWSATDGGYAFHTIPNHETEYRFTLANDSAQMASVSVEVLAPQGPIDRMIPSYPLTSAARDEVLASLPRLDSLQRIDRLELPGDRSSIPLRFGLAQDDSAESEAGAAAAESPGGSEETPPISVRHGLIVAVTDLEQDQTTWWKIDFRPDRPRRYLQAYASYDVRRERLSLHVAAREPEKTPLDGYRLQAEFASPLPRGTEARLKDTISSAKPDAVLYADVVTDAERVETVYLHVDGFPRAFIFRVPLWMTSTNLPESQDEFGIQIVQPEAGSAFTDEASQIPLTIRVDAPVGVFDTGAGIVEAGIDADRDREFKDDATLKLFSDRQADILLQGTRPNGAFVFQTLVSDFQLQVPVGNYQNARVNLLAKVQVDDALRWSEPVEIVLDQTGPEIQRLRVLPDRVVVKDAEVEARVVASDGGLSGVARVQVGFDLAGTGDLANGNTPIEATRDAAGVWLAKVPASLEPGSATLLAQAIDRAGNRGNASKVRLQIVTAEEAESIQQAATNRIDGEVIYDGTPVPHATATLTGPAEVDPVTANDAGWFTFAEVPPGKYTLKVRGVARNKPRFAEFEVEVQPAPANPIRRRIEVK